MKNILCFGDSNTYGLIPFGGRLDEHTRWTRVLSSLLGKDYWIHEEGLNGAPPVWMTRYGRGGTHWITLICVWRPMSRWTLRSLCLGPMI